VIRELFLQETKEPKVTWAQIWPVRWAFSASKPSTIKFGGCHSVIVTMGIVCVYKKSYSWMMTPKSQFLIGKRRDDPRDKITLSE
jgi:hypothetical protein